MRVKEIRGKEKKWE